MVYQLYRNTYTPDITTNTGCIDIENDLNQYPWELFITLHVSDVVDDCYTDWAFRRWRRYLVERVKREIAYKGFYLIKPSKHFHLLLLSRKNRKDRKDKRSLKDMDDACIQALCGHWKDVMRGQNAKITQVDCPDIASYLTGPNNLARYNQEWMPVDTNPKLLNRLKRAA